MNTDTENLLCLQRWNIDGTDDLDNEEKTKNLQKITTDLRKRAPMWGTISGGDGEGLFAAAAQFLAVKYWWRLRGWQ